MGRKETESAIQEARAGNPKRVNSVEELMADLHSDDKVPEFETFASVWDAIEDTPEAATEMKRRSAIMMSLQDRITRAGMTEPQAAELLGVTTSRVSDLVRGKFNLFSLDDLVCMAAKLAPIGKIKSFGPFGSKYEVGQAIRQLDD